MAAGVALMGFSISWLVPCGFGTDGFTALNLAVSAKLGLSFGTWQAALNIALFLLVLAFGRRHIGLGTFANMLLVGYICDSFQLDLGHGAAGGLFAPLLTRVLVAVPALGLFVLAAAVYMDMDLGVAPYDALPFILHKALRGRVPFSVLRVAYDLAVIALGYVLARAVCGRHARDGLLLGPAVEAVRRGLDRLLVRSAGAA